MLPPEIPDGYFKSVLRSPVDRENYKGKQDLELLEPKLRSLLVGIQNTLNEALRLKKPNVAGHVDHPRFHFDYIDLKVPNALAFQHDGSSFIGSR